MTVKLILSLVLTRPDYWPRVCNSVRYSERDQGIVTSSVGLFSELAASGNSFVSPTAATFEV